MNWTLIGILILVLAVLSSITVALIFYARHWATRHKHLVGPDYFTEGFHFKRYIPPELRERYDADRDRAGKKMLRAKAKLTRYFSFAILSAAAFLLGISFVANRDKLLAPIELEPAEIAAIDETAHQWRKQGDEQLPKLESVIASLKDKGFVIVLDDKDEAWRHDGMSPSRIGYHHWKHFFEHYELEYKKCHWKSLAQCRKSVKDGIIVAPPGHWDFATIDRLFDEGANLILYGPPAAIFQESQSTLSWRGLYFEATRKTSPRYVALRGDQKLTLGFDAGLIIGAYPAFKGYRVLSNQPQAVSIDHDHVVGGALETRLYAEEVGQGRMVWLDFAPHFIDHIAGINADYLNAVTTSVFRYLLRERYSTWATWPEGKRFAGFIEQDSEHKFEQAKRVVDLVTRLQFPITWYVLSDEAQENRDLTRRMAAVGEIACHGDDHAPFTKADRHIQTVRLARCQKVVETITGIKPTSFRPPEERYNEDTMDAMINTGITHYFAGARENRAVPLLEVSAQTGKSLVSIPRLVMDDYYMWETKKLDFEETRRLALQEIGWIEHLGGLYTFSFHSQFMESDDNLRSVEYIGRELSNRDTYFATVKDIAEWWRFRSQLIGEYPVSQELFERFKPVLITVDHDGTITREYKSFSEQYTLSNSM